MTASPWLSILIPVYNVADYVKECLESVLQQACSDVEIILLDDVSTDSSLARIQLLQQQYPDRFQIVQHLQNQGLSAARNTLLQHASGEYLWFIDSDDIMQNGAIAALKQIVSQHQPELVLCDFSLKYSPEHPKYHRNNRYRRSFSGPAHQKLSDTSLLLTGMFSAGQLHAWSKIAHRRCWQSGLTFPAGRYFEDIMTMPLLALTARSFYYCPQSWISYRQRPGSILSSTTQAMVRTKNYDLSSALLHLQQPLKQAVTDTDSRFYIDYFNSRNFIAVCRETIHNDADYPHQLRLWHDNFQQTRMLSPHTLFLGYLKRGWFIRALRLMYWLKRAGSATECLRQSGQTQHYLGPLECKLHNIDKKGINKTI